MVLVTGGSGFVGQHLVQQLSAQGAAVRALYHNHPPTGLLAKLGNVQWMKCDLLDVYAVEEAMYGISSVYHCAAIVSFDPSRREEMLHFNAESTTNIVNEALLQGIDKMVHLSSVAALGRTGEQKTITEEAEWGESSYNSAYGLSKYLAETEVWRGIGEGLNAVILNPGIILGTGNWTEGSSQLMKVASDELPFYTNGATSWVDVVDVVRSMILLMNSDIADERFISSAGNFSFKHIFTLMANALGKNPPHIAAGPLLTGLAWRWSALRSKLSGTVPAITAETARNAQGTSIYDNEKLLSVLPGFSYRPIEETIADMARSFTNSYIGK
jgi:nucleoside-diphosphate-sugar epimerase